MKRFGTFEGVFVPSLLSIFGVIMYLRLGWVVGQVGIVSALVIIVLSNFISFATGLSVSSVVTNIRIGHGGAYSIIGKSLGAETAGAMGLPLFLSQAISVAFYIIGFAETWVYIFPDHLFLAVCLVAWLGIMILSYASAQFSFRIQYVVLVLIGLSFVSMLFATSQFSSQPSPNMLSVPGDFFKTFAVFFPAVTGFMAGLTMSGELHEPRRNIPVGTLSAIAVSFICYIVLAFWFYWHASPAALVSHQSIVIDLGRWPWMIIAGIFGATFSSALNMCVIAPRTLFALSKNPALPFLKPFSYLNSRHEPSAAILLTAFIALLTIVLGNLNQVAVLLTMFFLVTYGLINLSVFVEQLIGIPSFRPSFKIPIVVSFLGALGCMIVMFLIDFFFGCIAILVIVLLYNRLIRHESKFYSPDVRSGILIFLSEQAAKIASRLPYYPKIWKPNVVAMIFGFDEFLQGQDLLQSFVYPSGRLMLLSVVDKENKVTTCERMEETTHALEQEGLFVKGLVIDAPRALDAFSVALQSLKGTYFPPNTCFLVLGPKTSQDSTIISLIGEATGQQLGVIVFCDFKGSQETSTGVINLWIRRGSPNVDLSILIAIQLQKNWQGRIRLLQIVASKEEKEEAVSFLSRLGELMRFPSDVDIEVVIGKFPQGLSQVPRADINIFGMPETYHADQFRDIVGYVKTPVVFLKDSPHESASA